MLSTTGYDYFTRRDYLKKAVHLRTRVEKKNVFFVIHWDTNKSAIDSFRSEFTANL